MTEEEAYFRRIFRETFTTGSGRRVLAQLLADAGYFDNDLKTTEEMAVENYAKTILTYMGLNDISNAEQFVEAIINVPVKD